MGPTALETLQQDIRWYEQVCARADANLAAAEAAVRSARLDAEDARANLDNANERLRSLQLPKSQQWAEAAR